MIAMDASRIHRRTFLKWTAISMGAALTGGLTAQEASTVPAYLQGVATRYCQDPNAAALEWFTDARFGLFVHYALASLLERGKPEYLELTGNLADAVERSKLPQDHPAREAGDQNELDHARRIQEDLMKQFRADQFDADAICDLAVAAQMRYVNLTTKHLGRLALYSTTTTEFSSVNAPAGRDLVGEMAKACATRHLGLFLYVPPETARTDGPLFEHNRIVLRELLTQYGPIAGIWFDGISGFNKNPELYSRLPGLFSHIRALQPQCLISFKEGAIGQEDFTSPEHFHLAVPTRWDTPRRQARWNIRLERWNRLYTERWKRHFKGKPVEINSTMQECFGRDGLGAPGGWINDATARHLDPSEVSYLLRKARSAGANLLMNIGPRGDGSIHPADAKTLRQVGRQIRQAGFPS
jgi:alpha-L-fucosidase